MSNLYLVALGRGRCRDLALIVCARNRILQWSKMAVLSKNVTKHDNSDQLRHAARD